MVPEDSVDMKGLRVEGIYFKTLLDKIGARMDVVHAGKYKDAGDMFTQTSMTPETREVLNNVLDQLYGDLINAVASGRKKQPEAIKALIDQGPFSGSQALSAGLVDKLAYEEQVGADLAKQLNQKNLTLVSHKAYLSVPSFGWVGRQAHRAHRGAGRDRSRQRRLRLRRTGRASSPGRLLSCFATWRTTRPSRAPSCASIRPEATAWLPTTSCTK